MKWCKLYIFYITKKIIKIIHIFWESKINISLKKVQNPHISLVERSLSKQIVFWSIRASASPVAKKKKILFSHTKTYFYYFNVAFDNTFYLTCSNFIFYLFIHFSLSLSLSLSLFVKVTTMKLPTTTKTNHNHHHNHH